MLAYCGFYCTVDCKIYYEYIRYYAYISLQSVITFDRLGRCFRFVYVNGYIAAFLCRYRFSMNKDLYSKLLITTVASNVLVLLLKSYDCPHVPPRLAARCVRNLNASYLPLSRQAAHAMSWTRHSKLTGVHAFSHPPPSSR